MNDHFEHAELHFSAKKFREAIDDFTKALDLEPGNVDAYIGLARCWIYLELYDQAVSVCHKGLDIDSQSAKLHGNLGYAYLYLFFRLKKDRQPELMAMR